MKRDLGRLATTKAFDQQAVRAIVGGAYGSAGYNLRRITRDQTSKLIGQLNEERQTNIGITHYVWRTSEDERVRPTHRRNNGVQFAWNSPPIRTGHPGNDIQCRCTADPVLVPTRRRAGPPRRQTAAAPVPILRPFPQRGMRRRAPMQLPVPPRASRPPPGPGPGPVMAQPVPQSLRLSPEDRVEFLSGKPQNPIPVLDMDGTPVATLKRYYGDEWEVSFVKGGRSWSLIRRNDPDQFLADLLKAIEDTLPGTPWTRSVARAEASQRTATVKKQATKVRADLKAGRFTLTTKVDEVNERIIHVEIDGLPLGELWQLAQSSRVTLRDPFLKLTKDWNLPTISWHSEIHALGDLRKAIQKRGSVSAVTRKRYPDIPGPTRGAVAKRTDLRGVAPADAKTVGIRQEIQPEGLRRSAAGYQKPYGDCTMRGFCNAFDLDYETVAKRVEESKTGWARQMNTANGEISGVSVEALDAVMNDLNLPAPISIDWESKLSIAKAKKEYGNNLFFVGSMRDKTGRSIGRHALAVVDGDVVDTWDSRAYFADTILPVPKGWVPPKEYAAKRDKFGRIAQSPVKKPAPPDFHYDPTVERER